MNICIPVDEDRGLESSVCAHFGSAPAFLIVDTESGSFRLVPNKNQHHDHGKCTPLASLQGERLDGVVVGGIGPGALEKFQRANIPVYASGHGTVAAAVAALRAGTLTTVRPSMACVHHGRSGSP